LPTTSTIVAIARDSALLRSLAFALEAHGYQVKTFLSWKTARESACCARCVIIDGSLPLSDRDACLEILAYGVRVVMLAEDETRLPQRHGLQVLHKPLSGSDVLGAVASLRTTP
jgi:DNA-binding response OmpR family regulator